MGGRDIKRNKSGRIKVIPINLPISGEYIPPGDKSISHRGIFLSAISRGKTEIKNISRCDDIFSTINCLKSLGVKINFKGEKLIIKSSGIDGFTPPERPIFCGNSGTTARFLMGCLAPSNLENVFLIGDSSLSKRPMERVAIPLRKMGAKIETTDGHMPLKISGRKSLMGINYNIPIPSAQVKSAITIAALFANSKSTLIEKSLTREHTEKMLSLMGAKIVKKGLKIEIEPSRNLKSLKKIDIPNDISSASFFISLAILKKNSKLTVKDVTLDSGRTGFLKALKKMGADIEILQKNGEIFKRGDIHVKYSELYGTKISKDEIPSMIDEIPILSLLMAKSKGKSVIEGLSELKYKESDRLISIYQFLKSCGCEVKLKKDTLEISGDAKLNKIELKSSDHRIVMMGIVAAAISKEGGIIEDINCLKISHPSFIKDLTSYGIIKIC